MGITAKIARESLERAQGNHSTANYGTIIMEFAKRGIPVSEIEPRINVLTFAAWKALGRHVRKGERGVKIVTWIPCDSTREKDGDKITVQGTRPWTATVFHISQTDAD